MPSICNTIPTTTCNESPSAGSSIARPSSAEAWSQTTNDHPSKLGQARPSHPSHQRCPSPCTAKYIAQITHISPVYEPVGRSNALGNPLGLFFQVPARPTNISRWIDRLVAGDSSAGRVEMASKEPAGRRLTAYIWRRLTNAP